MVWFLTLELELYDRDLRAFRNSFWIVSITRGEVAEGKRKPQSVLHEMNFKWEGKKSL